MGSQHMKSKGVEVQGVSYVKLEHRIHSRR